MLRNGLRFSSKFFKILYSFAQTPNSSDIFPVNLHLNPSGHLNFALPHSHCGEQTAMQNSAPVPAHGEPQSFHLPFALAHCNFVTPSKPPQSAAQPSSFSLPWQILSPQKGFLGSGLQLVRIISKNIAIIIVFFICFWVYAAFYLKVLLKSGFIQN